MGLLDRIRKKRDTGQRVFVLGLDGTPYGLMQSLFEQGVLKNLSAIAAEGSIAPMATTIPEVSSVAWTTFMTGVNPGKHGIFGFMDLKPGTYTTFFPNTTHVRAPTLWQRIAEEGKRSVIVNMPSTYPAREIQGVLVAGFVAIDLEKAVYPPSLVPWLRGLGYMLDVDASKARDQTEAFFRELHTSLEKREKTFHKLMKEEPWDLFAAIETGTDRLHHFFWSACEDPSDPLHSAFIDYYRAIDGVAGRLYDALDGKATFLALSDHGFGRLRHDLYLNRWLEENGYLHFSGEKRETVADTDPARTRAFCLDPGRIYLNVKRRFPGGTVAPGKPCEALLEELAQALAGMTHPAEDADGGPRKVIRRVYRKEEIYSGPFLSSAPDLILLAEPGTNLKGATQRTRVFDSEGPFTGMHTQDDAFFLADRPVSQVDGLHILDVSRTVLALLAGAGASAGELEGRPLLGPSQT